MKPLFLFVLLVWTITASAQNAGRPVGIIAGNVFDSASGKPMAGATVTLAILGDSVFSRKKVLPDDGHFEWFDLPFGHFRLSISSVGFQPLTLDSIFLRKERFDFNLGDLKMQTSDGSTLQNVVVFVEKALMENKDGKLTYNAGESAMSAGSTTADLLRNMPMIGTDPNGKILLRGKEPRILIDDKPVELSATQLADLLESLPGGAIEKIELMQNPPPEYASEPGGVINIVTKKGKIGFTGRATVSYGTRGEGNLGINGSYRTSKLNLTGTLNVGAGQITGNSYSRRTNVYTDSTNQLHTDAVNESRNLRPNLRLQADYDVNKRNQWSLVLQANSSMFDNESTTRYANLNRYEKVWKMSDRNVQSLGESFNINPQLSYAWKGKNPSENLRVIGSLAAGSNHNDRHFYQTFLDPETTMPNGIDSTQEQLTRNRFTNTSLRINYNKPLTVKGLTLGIGAGISTTRNDNNLQSSYLDKTGDIWVPAPLLSNEFIFNQAVSFGRLSVTWRNAKGWRLVPYLQTEFTHFTFDFKNLPGSANSYANWLPGVTIRKDLNKEHNLSLVYRMSIRRPGVGELNPAIDYADPYNLRSGNPTLDPSTAHNFDVNYGYTKGKSYVNGSLGYNIVSDIITSIRTLMSDGKTLVTYQNIATRREYEAGLWGGYSFSKMFRLNLSAHYSFNQYNEEDIAKYRYRNGNSFYSTVNYSLLFSSLFSMDGNFRYNLYADPQGQSRSNVNMNLGVQHKFFERRLIVALNVADPFTTQDVTTQTEGRNFRLESFRSNRTRNYRLSLSWQLNKMGGMPGNSSRKKG